MSASAATQWLVGVAGPLWADRGLDHMRGGFYDQLDMTNARNASDFRRLRVLCRQIYVFAELDRLAMPGAGQCVDHGVDYLLTRMRHPDGGFVDRVDLDGRVVDETRSLYDLAFVLFALAHAYRRRPDALLVEEARALMDFIAAKMSHPDGGFLEALPARWPRRQDPHMHLLEACLAWASADDSGLFRASAQQLIELAATRFWNERAGCIFEVFSPSLAPPEEASERYFEPGHHFEWTWLLYQARSIGLAAPPIGEALYRRAIDAGYVLSTGLLLGSVAPDGTARSTSCRLWQIAEWLRAETIADEVAIPDAAYAAIRRYLAAPIPGLWFERCDAMTGCFASEPAPASSLYHIVCAIVALREAEATAARSARQSVGRIDSRPPLV